jgi:general secretion pathway protein I
MQGMLTADLYKQPRRRREAGFTLLEVMVAVAIVATALVALLRLHLMSLDNTLRAQDLTDAVRLAEDKITAMGGFPAIGEEQGICNPDFGRFHCFTSVTAYPLPVTTGPTSRPPMEIRYIMVTVTWLEGQHKQQYTLEDYGTGSQIQ